MSQCPTCGGWNDPNVPGLCHACLCKQPDPPPAAVETAYLDLGTLNLKTGKRTPPDPPAAVEPDPQDMEWINLHGHLAEAQALIRDMQALLESLLMHINPNRNMILMVERARAFLARTAGDK